MNKRILTVQDITCLGRCSSLVASTIINTLKDECVVLPTFLYSEHSEFDNYYSYDLSKQNKEIIDRFIKEDYKFDCIYAGFLGSNDAINNLIRLLDYYKDIPFILDPVMGDNGELYSCFDNSYVNKMKELVKKADAIIPNLTEACLLTGYDYKNVKNEEDIKSIIAKLRNMGAKMVIITSVRFNDKIGIIASNSSNIDYASYSKYVDKPFKGLGDIYSSCFTSLYLRYKEELKAIDNSFKFINYIVDKESKKIDSKWYGVNYEEYLDYLINLK